MPSPQTYAQEIQSIFNENLLMGRSSRYMTELRRPSPGADTLLYQNIQMNQSNVKFLSEVWHSVLRSEYCADTQETEMKDDMTDG